VSPRGHSIGLLLLVMAGAFGAATAAAEPLLGLPGAVSALGAPWLVCAFAIGTLLRDRRAAAVAGALLLSGATAAYYGAQAYGYGPESFGYATSMTVAWGVAAGVAGGVMAVAGSHWRGATGRRAALLAAVPAAALAGEAVLLSRTWTGSDSGLVLGVELAAAAVLLLVLSVRRAPVAHALAGAVVLAVAFALVEAELRGYMRAAGWHGA
jgi:Family of unknown function (DUF6518)